jgi:hypothetical protein
VVRRLAREDVELLTATREAADLRDQAAVNRWFAASRPQVVFLAGGQGRRHQDITIAEFARGVAATVGYTGQISFDTSRPDGPPENCSMSAGWPSSAGAPAPRSRRASDSPIRLSSARRSGR